MLARILGVMIAYCPNCQKLFDTPLLAGTESEVTFKNIGLQCPNCGYPKARVLDGTYEFDKEGMVKLLSGPQFTVDTLNKLKSFAERAKEKNYSLEELEQGLIKISPLADFLIKGLPKGVMDIMIIIGIITGIIALAIENKKKETPSVTIFNTTVDGATTKTKYLKTQKTHRKHRKKEMHKFRNKKLPRKSNGENR